MRRFLVASLALIASLQFIALGQPPAGDDEPADRYAKVIKGPNNEGLQAMKAMQTPSGIKLDLWAAEPMLANPVAFCFDEKGRIYVAETFRVKKGVSDNRDHTQ